MATYLYRRPARRRVVLVNRVEDRAPGRAAYVLHRGRALSRARSLAAYLALARWAEQRRRQLAEEQRDATGASDDPDIDLTGSGSGGSGTGAEPATTETAAPPESPTSGEETPEEPSEEWTKGRLYELARELDIPGRSKLDKAALLDAVRDAWRGREGRPQSVDQPGSSGADRTGATLER